MFWKWNSFGGIHKIITVIKNANHIFFVGVNQKAKFSHRGTILAWGATDALGEKHLIHRSLSQVGRGATALTGSMDLQGKFEDPGLVITAFYYVHIKQRCWGRISQKVALNGHGVNSIWPISSLKLISNIFSHFSLQLLIHLNLYQSKSHLTDPSYLHLGKQMPHSIGRF